MESINYNGDNITDLARRKKLDTSSFVREMWIPVHVGRRRVFHQSLGAKPAVESEAAKAAGFKWSTKRGIIYFKKIYWDTKSGYNATNKSIKQDPYLNPITVN